MTLLSRIGAWLGMALVIVAPCAEAARPVGASYLSLDPSPRSASLAASGAGSVTGVSSLFLNPGGLGPTQQTEISASHTELFGDASFDSFAFARRINGLGWTPTGAWGAGVVSLRRSGIEARGADRSAGGDISAGDLSMFVSYGRRIGSGGVGITAKSLQQRIADESASGWAVDLGAQMKTPVRNLALGLSVLNLGPSMRFISQSFSLPTRAQAGLSYRLGALSLLADGSTGLNGGSSRFALGVEVSPLSSLVLRSGYRVDAGSRATGLKTGGRLAGLSGLAAGIGVKLGRYQLDYALVPHDTLDMSHQIGFSASFAD